MSEPLFAMLLQLLSAISIGRRTLQQIGWRLLLLCTQITGCGESLSRQKNVSCALCRTHAKVMAELDLDLMVLIVKPFGLYDVLIWIAIAVITVTLLKPHLVGSRKPKIGMQRIEPNSDSDGVSDVDKDIVQSGSHPSSPVTTATKGEVDLLCTGRLSPTKALRAAMLKSCIQ